MNNSARPSPEDPPLGVRGRHRRETRRAISSAALELFERKGVQGTTVDDIAAAAGVSPRTFFRYATTKENAISVDDDSHDRLVAQVRRGIAEGIPVVDAIEHAQRWLLDHFDSESATDHERALRVRRLVISEPVLLAQALASDAEQVEDFIAIVLETGDTRDELEARTLITALGTTLRLAIDEWVRRAERGQHSSSRDLYEQIRLSLARYHSATRRPTPNSLRRDDAVSLDPRSGESIE